MRIYRIAGGLSKGVASSVFLFRVFEWIFNTLNR